jgi:hypothetical protein
MNDKITYSILTWGPCVAKMKMTDAFHKALMEEADASQTESQLYQHRLAGIIKKEYELKDYTKVQPFISDIVRIYDHIWDKWRNADKPSKNQYLINALWVNYQRQYEFNPPHDHSDDLSFIAYLRIPEELKKEYKAYKGKSSGPGGISFLYGEGNRQAITYQAYFPEEKDFFIFPAWLKHWVAPFMSDVERVSVSGNIASHIPFKNVKPELLRKVAKK